MRRGVVGVGIVILFIGMSIVPIVGSLSIEKQEFRKSLPFEHSTSGISGISLITIKVAGEIGLNDWYVSDISVNFTIESDDIALIKYRIDGGSVQYYTESFLLTDDGEDIEVEYWAIDKVGNEGTHHTFEFDMDQTVPEIDIAYEVTGGSILEGWDLVFTATATDATSGMERVEFYINYELIGTVYGSGPTFQWGYKYYGGIAISVYATGFDNAGNSDTDHILHPVNIAVLESPLPNIDISKESSVQICSDDVLLSEIVERENHMVTEKSFIGNPIRVVSNPTYVIVVFDRKIGGDGWIVRNFSITFFYNSDRIDEVYYQIDDGGWMLYIEPLVISDDGVHSFSWYVVDSEGHTSTPDSISFKIDMTTPEINLMRERLAINEVKFTANVSDDLSGIDRVEFNEWSPSSYPEYIDYDFPYEWIWTGVHNIEIWVRVYDKAGNWNDSSMNTWTSYGYSQQSSNSLLIQFSEKFPLLNLLLQRLRI